MGNTEADTQKKIALPFGHEKAASYLASGEILPAFLRVARGDPSDPGDNSPDSDGPEDLPTITW